MHDELIKTVTQLRRELDELKAKRQRDAFDIRALRDELTRFKKDTAYVQRRDAKIVDEEARRAHNEIKLLHMEICHLRDPDLNNALVRFERQLEQTIGVADYTAPERLRKPSPSPEKK